MKRVACVAAALLAASFQAKAAEPDWKTVDQETLKHFQDLVRIPTTDPPGNEQGTADYLVATLKAAGIDVKTYEMVPHRPNVVARLKGSGKKKPILIMGHQDTVSVDESKWKFPPFSAERDQGWIYGRGTLDDKDNVTAFLMTMLLLKRQNIPLDRDVIFLSEVGEEGSSQYGIGYMVDKHFDDINAEYCLAEGGEARLRNGKVIYAEIQTTEKVPNAIRVTAKGISGHGSVPLLTNPIAHLAKAVEMVANWQAPIKLNETTYQYFERLASVSSPEDAARYRAVLKPDTAEAKAAFQYFLEHEPNHASLLHTSVSPNIFAGGYRINVIPSDAHADFDVRVVPNEDKELTLKAIRDLLKDDPAVTADWIPRGERKPGNTRLDTEAFKVLEDTFHKAYGAVVLPVMSTGATDMAQLRQKGVQCYGISSAYDEDDPPKGFGMHSDQERIIENELYRFVHASYDTVAKLARAK
jgi:acetylornithine deacetylase/succinyl-diaminopimelate desuccinylase-like protein